MAQVFADVKYGDYEYDKAVDAGRLHIGNPANTAPQITDAEITLKCIVTFYTRYTTVCDLAKKRGLNPLKSYTAMLKANRLQNELYRYAILQKKGLA